MAVLVAEMAVAAPPNIATGEPTKSGAAAKPRLDEVAANTRRPSASPHESKKGELHER